MIPLNQDFVTILVSSTRASGDDPDDIKFSEKEIEFYPRKRG